MAPALDVDVIRSEVLAVVLSLAEDRIPNIRFNVAKALEVLAVRLGSLAPLQAAAPNESEAIRLIKDGVLPALETLTRDKDADVRFFAEKGHAIAEDIINSWDRSLTAEGQEVIMSDA